MGEGGAGFDRSRHIEEEFNRGKPNNRGFMKRPTLTYGVIDVEGKDRDFIRQFTEESEKALDTGYVIACNKRNDSLFQYEHVSLHIDMSIPPNKLMGIIEELIKDIKLRYRDIYEAEEIRKHKIEKLSVVDGKEIHETYKTYRKN